MAFNSDISYHVFKDYEIPFDEKGSTCGTVRLVQWIKDGNEPDESKAKIEIRKTYISEAEEKLGKGYTFSTEEGPGELAVGLLKAGFGDTKEVLRVVRTRDDFYEAATNINNYDEGSDDGQMFDMRDLLMSIDSSDDSEEEEDE